MTSSQESTSLEQRAYRQAGHATMAFLILKAGSADDWFMMPIASEDRPLLLAEFEQVTIENQPHDWGDLTFSLRSLITASIVLLAGFASERIRYIIDEKISPHSSKLSESAWHLLGSYVEESGEDNLWRRDEKATELMLELYNWVDKELRQHWAAVEALVHTLLKEKTLTKHRAFAIIETNLPEATKDKVLEIGNQTGDAEKLWMRARECEAIQALQVQSRASQDKKKAWWEFWKK